MVALEETISVPLAVTEYGTIRVRGSRVSLDSIVHHFKLGATAEQIAQSFPSVSLEDIYAAIAYYLTHREAVEEYLQHQEAEADELQEQIESSPDYQRSTPNCARASYRDGRRARKATTIPPQLAKSACCGYS